MALQETVTKSTSENTLADVLELVLDKGVVIAGDIQIKLADVDLLTIKIRLLIAGVDRAKQLGIDWWEKDPYLSSEARKTETRRGRWKLGREKRTKAKVGRPRKKKGSTPTR